MVFSPFKTIQMFLMTLVIWRSQQKLCGELQESALDILLGVMP
jgi:hypothetical protein